MSENEGGDSKFMTGFLVGFVVGVLICLGAGGSLALVWGRQQAMEMRAREAEALMRAEEARAAAEEALRRVEQARKHAEKAAAAKDNKAR
jgi:hypothetical protein